MSRRPNSRPTGRPPGGARRREPDEKEVLKDGLAAAVKLVYVRARSRWMSRTADAPVEYRPPRSYEGRAAVSIDGAAEVQKASPSEWASLAEWLTRHRLPPVGYITLAFELLPHDVFAPEPRQLKSDKYLKLWADNAPLVENRLRVQLARERREAEAQLTLQESGYGRTRDQAVRYVMAAGDMALSPLFRYCLAVVIDSEVSRKCAERWEARAVLQFEQHRAEYLATWDAVLPEGFAERSRKIYPHLLAKGLL